MWLSFVGEDQKNLGVCIVEISDDEIAEALSHVPDVDVESGMVLAAVAKAWEMECNPGGNVQAWEVDREEVAEKHFPLHRLLQRQDIEALAADGA